MPLTDARSLDRPQVPAIDVRVRLWLPNRSRRAQVGLVWHRLEQQSVRAPSPPCNRHAAPASADVRASPWPLRIARRCATGRHFSLSADRFSCRACAGWATRPTHRSTARASTPRARAARRASTTPRATPRSPRALPLFYLVSPRACSALAGTIDVSTDGIVFARRHRERRHPGRLVAAHDLALSSHACV